MTALPTGTAEETVIVIDDDEMMRDSIDGLLRSVGIATRVFPSAVAALAEVWPTGPSCMVVDIRMPHLGGLELQERLNETGKTVPVIFITGHGDIPMTVKAMKAGAVDFLTKPFREQDLLEAVHIALDRARRLHAQQHDLQRTRDKLSLLTPREKEVMSGVARGLLNKQIAGELGLSEITVKLHRSSLMKKLGIRGVAELVRMIDSYTDS
ncbi:response regulator receiver domain protein [Novosphingobium nitrogenifigens DSM 19370]|uniref:Response regulator receiver domain protein n=1 Tax=Novosphingobium nitrogenifigens DSM 19370 TaxID=983920 RepID=F1ZC09_9SPHN|nr:response regulator [Novosphingobium nitrogenifigens]EGD57855.1 response regulator receiver domain protein [Novosphingobium nitrogenifigens DSM 19370]